MVLRSGAYLVHDDGFYRDISPFRDRAVRFQVSRWPAGRGSVATGAGRCDPRRRKEDFPVDQGLPQPQRIGPRLGDPTTSLTGAQITAVDDQHSHLRFDPAVAAVGIGDVVRLGLSHPCTAMDKWKLIPVLRHRRRSDHHRLRSHLL